MRAWTVAGALMAAALFASCGGSGDIATGTPGSSDLAPVQPCELLTRSDLGAVIGPTGDGTPSVNAPFFDCAWTSEDMDYNVNLYVYHDLRDDTVAYYDQYGDGDNVNGIGEQANWSSPLESLQVLQGTYAFRVSVVSSFPDFDGHAAANELAGVIVENLPE